MSGHGAVRAAGICVCLALLVGLFVLGGTGWPAPSDDPIDLADPAVDPADHAGEQIEAYGEVVETDPVVVELEEDGVVTLDDHVEHLVVEDAPPVEEGEYLVVHGTITTDGALDADPDRATTREPWEVAYMYAVSAVGLLIVAILGVDAWRVDRRTLSLVPRDRPLHRTLWEGGRDA